MKNGRDVADLLEIEHAQLHYITSRRRERYSYHAFEIPKKSGETRQILAPHPTVKILQRKLLHVFNLVYEAHPAAHGFVPKHSILTNAQPHQGKRFVLNVDLEDFFPSIIFPRVRGLFIKHFRLPNRAATVLARVCCNTDDDPDHLPQGAPTSPIISNMIVTRWIMPSLAWRAIMGSTTRDTLTTSLFRLTDAHSRRRWRSTTAAV
ncbi:MAG: reverse transcriptase domain-containing protein [Chloroflexi bacterium]|nr:reverse transcriptase domain-containing protein [Chloroflexota bacterium]